MNSNKEYNIGLDIGTNSVGWAVVEAKTQKIIRKGNKALWGIRLFDNAETAEGRRIARSTRRRYDRRRERIRLLQAEFNNEINNVDSNFFQKLKESKYVENDKLNKTIQLSKKEKDDVKKYQNKYKTIYHLRKELISSNEKMDIRLVYLAIHHIIKYRGNFLQQSSNFNVDNLNLKEKIVQFFDTVVRLGNNELNFPEDYFNLINIDELEKNLINPSKNDVKKLISKQLTDVVGKKFSNQFGKLMVGNKGNISELLMLDDKKIEISFSANDYEDKYAEYESSLKEDIEVLDSLKQLYDCIYLKKIFSHNENPSISCVMVDRYNQHHNDLHYLKKIFNYDRKLYDKFFRSKKDLCIYDKYVSNKIEYEEFSKELTKLLDELCKNNDIEKSIVEEYKKNIKVRIENEEFLPRISSTDNGMYPYQLNKYELIKIIENQGKYYPFLLNTLNDGKTYKLVKLLEFKIPYYVGPLVSSKNSSFAWMSRKKDGIKITPHNFDEVVDKEKTAEDFIKRMISKCTYLLDEYAMANNSILYSRFKVLNELKQIRINGKKIELDLQQKIIKELFMKESGTITEKKFRNYLLSTGEYSMYDEFVITGYSNDKKFANNMQSYVDFFGENGIFKNTNYSQDDAEKIIEWITIFEDKDILVNKIKSNYPSLDEQTLSKIIKKNYKGWGKLSKKLLTTNYYKDKESGILKSILCLMEETDKNFMQIINDDQYKFQDMIKEHNKIDSQEKLNYSVVEELATSPQNKRGIYQALKIVDELVKYLGYDPKNIIIEMTREDKQNGKRTDSKKARLQKLYKDCKEQIENYKKLNEEMSAREITTQRMLLYFLQEGKCLYCHKPLNIEDIEDQSLYEIDHIIPRSIIKDDSTDNKALVCRHCNQIKRASLVLPRQFRNEESRKWWEHLKKCNLISAKKFYNLIRREFSNEDIAGFINRQLVETSQITKHVANILENYYKKTKVIYLKAKLSHDYRERYELFKFREINDYHHAHDAYLAAVLGEYKENYMKYNIDGDMITKLNERIVELNDGKKDKLKYGFVINSLDEDLNDYIYEISDNFYDNKTGEIVFDAHKFNNIVEDTLYRNDILFTRKSEIRNGKFYKETIKKKGEGNIQLKSNMPVSIYGGYTETSTKNLILISYNENMKKIIGIPMEIATINDKDKIDKFIKTQINLKKNMDYEIVKNKIPFDSEFIHQNQKVFIKGYSIQKKGNELSNAVQLKIRKELMRKWKYAFEYILHGNSKYKEEAIKKIDEIYTYLIKLEDYSLYKKIIERIDDSIEFNALTLEKKVYVIVQLLVLFKCDSVNANLKEVGLGDRLGRLNGINIQNGILISKSITGIHENRYEF